MGRLPKTIGSSCGLFSGFGLAAEGVATGGRRLAAECTVRTSSSLLNPSSRGLTLSNNSLHWRPWFDNLSTSACGRKRTLVFVNFGVSDVRYAAKAVIRLKSVKTSANDPKRPSAPLLRRCFKLVISPFTTIKLKSRTQEWRNTLIHVPKRPFL